jgi:hypothetical protein
MPGKKIGVFPSIQPVSDTGKVSVALTAPTQLAFQPSIILDISRVVMAK